MCALKKMRGGMPMMVVVTHFIATMIGAMSGMICICLMQASRVYGDD